MAAIFVVAMAAGLVFDIVTGYARGVLVVIWIIVLNAIVIEWRLVSLGRSKGPRALLTLFLIAAALLVYFAPPVVGRTRHSTSKTI